MGDEETAVARIEALELAGATELLANVVGDPDERLRGLELLAQLSRR